MSNTKKAKKIERMEARRGGAGQTRGGEVNGGRQGGWRERMEGVDGGD